MLRVSGREVDRVPVNAFTFKDAHGLLQQCGPNRITDFIKQPHGAGLTPKAIVTDHDHALQADHPEIEWVPSLPGELLDERPLGSAIALPEGMGIIEPYKRVGSPLGEDLAW